MCLSQEVGDTLIDEGGLVVVGAESVYSITTQTWFDAVPAIIIMSCPPQSVTCIFSLVSKCNVFWSHCINWIEF